MWLLQCNAVSAGAPLRFVGKACLDTYRTGRHVLAMSLAVLKMRSQERSASARLVTSRLEFLR